MVASTLLGLATADLEAARATIEQGLGTQLRPHESLYRGGDYYRLSLPEGLELVVQRNLDGLDKEPAEPDFSSFGVLVYVNHVEGVLRPVESLLEQVEGLRLLRSAGAISG